MTYIEAVSLNNLILNLYLSKQKNNGSETKTYIRIPAASI